MKLRPKLFGDHELVLKAQRDILLKDDLFTALQNIVESLREDQTTLKDETEDFILVNKQLIKKVKGHPRQLR